MPTKYGSAKKELLGGEVHLLGEEALLSPAADETVPAREGLNQEVVDLAPLHEEASAVCQGRPPTAYRFASLGFPVQVQRHWARGLAAATKASSASAA